MHIAMHTEQEQCHFIQQKHVEIDVMIDPTTSMLQDYTQLLNLKDDYLNKTRDN